MRVFRAALLAASLAGLSATLAACDILDGIFAPEAGGELKVRERWRQPQPGYSNAQPAVAGELVFVGTGDGQVIARERASGAVRWTAQAGTRRVSGANLAVSSGVLVAPLVLHTVGLDAATGAELWRYSAPLDTVGDPAPRPGTVDQSRIAVDDGAAYIPAWGGSVAAVELRSGRVRWSWQPEPGTRFRLGAEGATVSGDTVFATLWHFLDASGSRAEAWVVAIDARTGAQLWRTVLPRVLSGVLVAGRPVLSGDRVIAMLVTGDVFALDRRTGRQLWHVPAEPVHGGDVVLAVFASPAVWGDVVYADAGRHHLRALRASDGSLLWRTRYDGQFKDDLLVTEKRIYGPSGQLHVFDRESGRYMGMVGEPGKTGYRSFFPATPAADAGRIFAVYEGGVMAFDEP